MQQGHTEECAAQNLSACVLCVVFLSSMPLKKKQANSQRDKNSQYLPLFFINKSAFIIN